MMTLFRLQLLGPVQVDRDGESIQGFKSRKTLALLGYLAAESHPVSRGYLVELFWPDQSETRGRNNLSQALHNILSLWPGCFEVNQQTVQFSGHGSTCLDIRLFNELAARNEVNALGMAADLYRGDFMAGMYLDDCPEFEQWLRLQQEIWQRRVTQVLRELIAHHISQNEVEQALQFLSRLLAIDSGDEEGYRQKMELLARSGQRSAALAQYETCRRYLTEELGVEPAHETVQLYEQIRAGAVRQETRILVNSGEPPSSISSSLALTAPVYNNLPAQSTSFIGRETELAIIDQDLSSSTCRLLTIIGLGGIGKTRLALQAAATTTRFRHGVCFVPLVSTSSAEFLTSAIADALNVSLYGRGDPKAQLLNYLSSKEMLLVLDNFEHLIGGANLLVEILECAPHIKILVTSRERLGLYEEWVLDLQGLPFPESEDIQQVESYSAVQLFLQRAQQARADFWLRFLEKPAVARICRLVEGLPLGIELAAAWTRSFSCQDIAAELEKNHNFLTTSLQNIPPRHRSVRAVFEHSWGLLSEEERSVFRRLSVFWRGFSRKSAEQVVGASAFLLSALVDKSLLRRTALDHYEIHELLRQYGAEKLAENPDEKKEVKGRHCRYYAEFLQEQEVLLKRGEQKEALEAISLEIDNVRAGWQWAVANRSEEDFEKYREALFLVHTMQSWFQEGEAVFKQAAASLRQAREKADSDRKIDKMLGQVLARQGVFCASLGHYDQARAIMQEGLAIFQDTAIRQSAPLGLNYLGAIAWALGEYVEAKQLCQESLTTTEKTGDRWKQALILEYLGMIAISLGDYSDAKAIAERSLTIFRDFGYRSGIAFSLNLLGIATHNLGQYREAKQLCQESLAIAREIGDRWEEALSLEYLAMTAISLGEYAEAQTLAQESLAIFREFGYRSGIAFCLNLLGTVARNLGEYGEAKRLHQEVLQTCKALDYSLGVAITSYYLGHTAYLLGEHTEARRLLTDSLTLARKLAYQRGITQSLNALGSVAYALGEYKKAKKYLLEALNTTQKIHALPIILDIFLEFAKLFIKEGKTMQAMELLAFPLHHAACKKETRDQASGLLAKLASELPGPVLATAQENGKTNQLEKVVAKLLNERVGPEWACS
ncbi:MAG: transcriptional activator [Chloroflexota bacterium]|nr:MAG: transcriptional activator [Chloroflexota bacterium]